MENQLGSAKLRNKNKRLEKVFTLTLVLFFIFMTLQTNWNAFDWDVNEQQNVLIDNSASAGFSKSISRPF